MRTQHNVKSLGQVSFARQQEELAPEMACFRELPKVHHVWTRQQLLADVASFLAATTLISKHTGEVPVFHVKRPEICLDFCLPGVLGERISS